MDRINVNKIEESNENKGNLEYLNKIEKSLKQIEDGDVVVKTLEEMEQMTKKY